MPLSRRQFIASLAVVAVLPSIPVIAEPSGGLTLEALIRARRMLDEQAVPLRGRYLLIQPAVLDEFKEYLGLPANAYAPQILGMETIPTSNNLPWNRMVLTQGIPDRRRGTLNYSVDWDLHTVEAEGFGWEVNRIRQPRMPW